MKIHVLWVFYYEISISEVTFWIYPFWKNSRWPPSKIQMWVNLRSNCGRIKIRYTYCRFLSVGNPFLRLFFRFGHIGKNSRWPPPKIQLWDNLGSNGGRIIWKYTFCGFMIMRNPFLRLLLGFDHIGKIPDGLYPEYKCGLIWDLIVVESQENSCIVGFWVWGIHFWSYFSDSAILKKFKMAATQNTIVG